MEVEEKLMKKGGQKQSLAERMKGVRVCFCGMYQLINFFFDFCKLQSPFEESLRAPLIGIVSHNES